MTSEQIISQYQNSEKERKEQLISQFLLLQEGDKFYSFLDCIYLNEELDPKKYSIDILSQDRNNALIAAKYLLNANNPNDTLNILKYYGARIIDKMGNGLDYKITIPLLISAYNIEDYRDARWSISMALATLINEPIQLITKVIDTNDIVKEELFCNLESYTAIDFHSKYEIYNQQTGASNS